MKKIILLIISVLFITSVFSQELEYAKFKVDKQSMSTPMSNLEDMFVGGSYYTRPVTVSFDSKTLFIYFDNNKVFINKKVTEVKSDADFDDDDSNIDRFYYTFDDNNSDTIMFVVDYDVPYIQLVLPTPNTKGEKIGYTSYTKYGDGNYKYKIRQEFAYKEN